MQPVAVAVGISQIRGAGRLVEPVAGRGAGARGGGGTVTRGGGGNGGAGLAVVEALVERWQVRETDSRQIQDRLLDGSVLKIVLYLSILFSIKDR